MEDILRIIENQKKDLYLKMNDHAKEKNFRLNEDSDVVNEILNKLLIRKRKFGDIYCPCRIVTGDEEKNKEIACPCIFHVSEVESHGSCLCGLFIK
jgi:ferredoxin-thioredoxin reductase catalytic chain